MVRTDYVGPVSELSCGEVLGNGSELGGEASGVEGARKVRVRGGGPVAALPEDQIRRIMHQRAVDFRDKAPTTAEQAATIILDGVRANRWRILVGEDAERLDRMVRNDPESAYTPEFAEACRHGRPPLVCAELHLIGD